MTNSQAKVRSQRWNQCPIQVSYNSENRWDHYATPCATYRRVGVWASSLRALESSTLAPCCLSRSRGTTRSPRLSNPIMPSQSFPQKPMCERSMYFEIWIKFKIQYSIQELRISTEGSSRPKRCDEINLFFLCANVLKTKLTWLMRLRCCIIYV